ncbi:MAG: alanine--tRNA ligase [Alteromonadaceae bacterium]|nr:MAG: alanine--tRNA ligase [Alteromonadaceae bacterium]
MKSAEVRDAFLKYFEQKDHTIVSSSSLVPGNDPTLLFTNAGMVQFKDVFLGDDKRSYKRATSSQRCVRAGGKHNDLENVGYTARHHTFFEMLGNFSFGDYFKRDAIKYAWEFLTVVLKLPAEKLWVTVHISDDEAEAIWKDEIGIDPTRFSRLDEDNFWQMGDTGPCGPSSEIFYDHGEDIPGGPPGSKDEDLDRYIEIWNLVFMQYERQANGDMVPLPKPSVDTGMGLERIAAVMQKVHSNYEIDLFQALLKATAEITETQDLDNKSLRVIADHIRSCSFLVLDGVLPSNEGRGYVLRRIIRRAIRHGHKLGQKARFFHRLVGALVEQMSDAYPDLKTKQAQIEKVLLAEEVQFAKTLDNGMSILESRLAKLDGDVIPGEIVFLLHDTYGFPVDLTNDIAREKGLQLDLEGYEQRMAEQRKQSRESGSFKVDYSDTLDLDGNTEFVGYQQLSAEAPVSALVKDGASVDVLTEGDEGVIVLANTPFYAESGGQAGDCGYINCNGAKFEVRDCQKSGANHLHVGVVLSGEFKIGDQIQAVVDESVRAATARNHSATHLLHAALREILGDHVEQKGSLVDSEKLRFDFSHTEGISKVQLQEIADRVNGHIQQNTPVTTDLCDMESAKEKGAMALFGEKYGEEVRVLTMAGGFSVELCGGTHVARSGDIALMKIVSESGIAAGVRRIEAITADAAVKAYQKSENALASAAAQLKTSPGLLGDKVEQLLTKQRQLEKELQAVKTKLTASSVDDWLAEAKDFSGIKVLVKTLQDADAKSLRDIVDQLKNKLGRSAVLIASVSDGKINLAAGVSKDACSVLKAGDIVRHVASNIGGKGGGRPDMAQGGGSDVEALPAAIDALFAWLAEQPLS